jgi:hypothetical protein
MNRNNGGPKRSLDELMVCVSIMPQPLAAVSSPHGATIDTKGGSVYFDSNESQNLF